MHRYEKKQEKINLLKNNDGIGCAKHNRRESGIGLRLRVQNSNKEAIFRLQKNIEKKLEKPEEPIIQRNYYYLMKNLDMPKDVDQTEMLSQNIVKFDIFWQAF